MRETKLKLTSVKVYKPLYHKFKVRAMDDEFTLQKLVNRAMDLYKNEPSFKDKIFEHTNLALSGSINL